MLPFLLLLSVARAEPVVQAPAPLPPLQAPAQDGLRLQLGLRLERLQAGLLARALDRLIYIDMAPTPGVDGGEEPGPPGPPPGNGPPGPPPGNGPPGPPPGPR